VQHSELTENVRRNLSATVVSQDLVPGQVVVNVGSHDRTRMHGKSKRQDVGLMWLNH
jgi:hypothetical protein